MERVHDSLRHFRNRFGEDIQSVEERFGSNPWRQSHLLPTCAEESADIESAKDEKESA